MYTQRITLTIRKLAVIIRQIETSSYIIYVSHNRFIDYGRVKGGD